MNKSRKLKKVFIDSVSGDGSASLQVQLTSCRDDGTEDLFRLDKCSIASPAGATFQNSPIPLLFVISKGHIIDSQVKSIWAKSIIKTTNSLRVTIPGLFQVLIPDSLSSLSSACSRGSKGSGLCFNSTPYSVVAGR